MLRRLALVLLASVTLAGCDRIADAVNPPIDDSGAYMLLEIDTSVVANERLATTSDDMAAALRGATPAIRYNGRGVANNAARITLVDPAEGARALQVLQAMAPDLTFTHDGDGVIESRLTPAALEEATARLQAQSVLVLGRRGGVSALSVAPHGDTQILVRSAQTAFAPRVRAALTTIAQVNFHMVNDLSPEEAIAGRIPAGFMVVQPYPGVGSSIEVVAERPSINGARIESARASTDQYTGEYVIAFDFDREGARQFCRITTEHTHRRFAILLDNQVLTAPTINEPICGGSGQIAGNFTAQSASDFVTMLSAGGLPAPVTIVAEGVGPLPATP